MTLSSQMWTQRLSQHRGCPHAVPGRKGRAGIRTYGEPLPLLLGLSRGPERTAPTSPLPCLPPHPRHACVCAPKGTPLVPSPFPFLPPSPVVIRQPGQLTLLGDQPQGSPRGRGCRQKSRPVRFPCPWPGQWARGSALQMGMEVCCHGAAPLQEAPGPGAVTWQLWQLVNSPAQTTHSLLPWGGHLVFFKSFPCVNDACPFHGAICQGQCLCCSKNLHYITVGTRTDRNLPPIATTHPRLLRGALCGRQRERLFSTFLQVL